MDGLSVRRAAAAGLAVSLVVSAAIAAESARHLHVFAYVLLVSLAASAVVVGLVVLIDRRLRKRHDSD